jgi:hypothetical protein
MTVQPAQALGDFSAVRPTPPFARRPAVGIGACVAALLLAASCGGDDPRDPGAFCRRLNEDAAALATPPGDAAGVEALVSLYRELDARTPLQIRDDWRRLTEVLELAASVDLADPEAADEFYQRVSAVDVAARNVTRYAQDTCGIELGTMAIAPPSTATPSLPAETGTPSVPPSTAAPSVPPSTAGPSVPPTTTAP